ncbi:MAG: hypothetical protein CMJ64_09595 [Planctomycetaceae bacterium]|nr:hypothetical protein [Planctomycetaceae bacterium]
MLSIGVGSIAGAMDREIGFSAGVDLRFFAAAVRLGDRLAPARSTVSVAARPGSRRLLFHSTFLPVA